MNSYFVSHPEMVLGEMKMESTRFGMDSACKARQDKPLSELLSEAVQRINGEIPEQNYEIDGISDGQDAELPADPNCGTSHLPLWTAGFISERIIK